MAQTTIPMSQKELERFDIITQLIQQRINGSHAAKQLGVTVRHVKRLKKRVKEQGAVGLQHALRGKPSNRGIDTCTIQKVVSLIQKKYYDCRPTFIAEKLKERDKIVLSNETIRTIMIANNLWKIRSRKNTAKKHYWRARKEHYGEMEQFDGSYHVWFGTEESCLLASIDDATGTITHAEFVEHEGVFPIFSFWKEYLLKHGRPMSIYLDKFSTYKVNHKNAVDNKDLITQFERACRQVGLRLITAHSPQAKGRIERLFKTLQDRLVKELRLAGITTMAAANTFLQRYIPTFNTQFGRVAAKRGNVHTRLTKQLHRMLPQIFSRQHERVVQNDYTVRFTSQYFQLTQEQPTTVYKKERVTIEEHLDGSTKIRLRDQCLAYLVLPERPKRLIDVGLPAITIKKQTHWIPPKDHPWRKSMHLEILKKQHTKEYEKVKV